MKRFSETAVNLIASRARALAEPARVRIVEALSRGEQPVGRLAVALAMQQSTASKHLQVLFHAGLVRRRRDGSAVIYSVAADEVLAWFEYFGRREIARSRAHLV